MKEKRMRKVFVAVLIALFATVGLLAQEKPATTPKATPKATKAKEARWDGVIIRQNKADSTFTVRRRGTTNDEKTIVFNSATKWTKLNKPAEMSMFKDRERIIAVGTFDEKGRLVATHIDLRLQ
jgi:hypothetical protein